MAEAQNKYKPEALFEDVLSKIMLHREAVPGRMIAADMQKGIKIKELKERGIKRSKSRHWRKRKKRR